MKERTCRECGAVKPDTAEHFRRRTFTWRSNYTSSTCRPCDVAAVLDWGRRNPEKLARKKRRHSVSDAGRAGNRRRAITWNARHPETKAEKTRRRDALKRGALIATLTRTAWRSVLEYFGHACAYCLRAGVALEQDHVLAVSAGGAHSEDNVVPACRTCNATKNKRGILQMLVAPGEPLCLKA